MKINSTISVSMYTDLYLRLTYLQKHHCPLKNFDDWFQVASKMHTITKKWTIRFSFALTLKSQNY